MNVVPILIIFSEKLQNTKPFYGINSGICIIAIMPRELKQAAENTKIRTIIPYIAISCISVLLYWLSSTIYDEIPRNTSQMIIIIVPIINGFLRPSY